MRKIWFFIVLIFLAACGTHNNDYRDKKIFRYNEAAGISSLDPVFARDQANIWAVNQLYNGLVQLDDSLKVKPCLAKSWSISDSGRLYTFTLQKEIYFHPDMVFGGRKRILTAEDVAYSLRRLSDPATASPGRWVLSSMALDEDSLAEVKAPNDSTVILRLKEVFSPFLSLLAMQYCAIVPHEAVEHYGKDFRRHPVGTGPFVFKRWEEGVKLVLLKNPEYFERDEQGKRLPYLDAVSITFIGEKHTAFMEFMLGKYDFISGIDPNYKDVLLDKNGVLKSAYTDKFVMAKSSYLNTEYLGFQFDFKSNPALRDVRVRRAINVGFDRAAMMRYLRNGMGIPAYFGLLPPALAGNTYDTSRAGFYNPELAASLLKEAGYPNGKGLPEIKLYTTASYLDLCEFMQSQLGTLGIKLSLEVLPPASLRDMMYRSNASFFRGSWIADYPDAENYLSLLYGPNKVPNGPNYTGFSNKRYDQLYRWLKSETDPAQRLIYIREMNSIMMDEVPVIPLYYDIAVRFIRKGVSGMEPNPLNLLILKKVDKVL